MSVLAHSALHAAQAFENILAFAVRRVCPKKPLWIEHEGRHVGKVRRTNLKPESSSHSLVYILCSPGIRSLRRAFVGDTCTTRCGMRANQNYLGLGECIPPFSILFHMYFLLFMLLSGALVMLSMGKDLRVRRLVDDYCSADVNVEESREKLKICTWSSCSFDTRSSRLSRNRSFGS